MTSADPPPLPAHEQERLACLARLISPVVHRLNNSLAVMRGACDLTLQQSYSSHLHRASAETGRVADTLAQLSACAKTPRPQDELFDPAMALANARLLLDALASSHAVEFRDRLREGEPCPVRGNRVRLEQMLVWFAAEGFVGRSTAGRSLGAGSAPARLRFSLHRAGTRLVFTGLRTRGEQGGPEPPDRCLAAAAELESGTTVIVRAGQRCGGVRFLRITYPTRARAGAEAISPPVVSTVRGRILLVEGDTPRRELVRAVLEEAGFRLRVPARSEPTSEELPFEEVDVVLLDARQVEHRAGFLAEVVRAADARGPVRLALLGDTLAADDHPHVPRLTDPFRPAELLEFVAALVP